MFRAIKLFFEERRLRKNFERYFAKYDDWLMTKEEAWIHFRACEQLGEEEVRRQLEMGVY